MNAILLISLWFTIKEPVVPSPVIMFTTPSGIPACSHRSANNKAVNDVVSAGFKTTVFPVANAGATFHANISNGKFHGII